MLIVAAAIVGGTAMTGGRGSPLMTVIALIGLNALTNGLGYLGASKSVKLIAHGAVLAAIILFDAWREVRAGRVRGRRRELMDEVPGLLAALDAENDESEPGDPGDEDDEEGDEEMTRRTKERYFAMVCVTALGLTAMVLIYAMWTTNREGQRTVIREVASASAATGTGPVEGSGPAERERADPLDRREALLLKATDGQPLVWIDDSPLKPPVRPANPKDLSDDDPLRWYDHEYAGWRGKKLPMPESPGNGPTGKKVVSLQYMDHPYWQGYGNGMRRLAEAYGMDLTIMEAGNDNKVQMDQVEQAIGMNPDMVILTPVDSNGVVPMLKRLHDAKIPCIASNLLPVDEGMKYAITWTGPDDWGQFRMLARTLAEHMKGKGNYCVIRHVAGTSCYLSRTWAAVSELKKIAPEMRCLDMQSTDLKTEETKKQVLAWIKKYGDDLTAIVSADDSKAQVGIAEALKDAGREDIVCVAAGSSRTGLEYIKEGKLLAVTYQSAEGDGALPIEIAARWFRGQAIERPVYYLRKVIITRDNVDEFLPAQW